MVPAYCLELDLDVVDTSVVDVVLPHFVRVLEDASAYHDSLRGQTLCKANHAFRHLTLL